MDVGFDFDYRSRHARRSVAGAVEQVWFARGTVPYRSEQIAPTGSTVVILILGEAITQTASSRTPVTSDRGLVIGPHTAPVVNEPHGETHALGIVTTAVGCESLLDRPPAGLRGRVTPLDDADPRLVGLRDRLATAAACGADPEQLLDLVEAHVAATVRVDVSGMDRVEQAVEALVARPREPIADIAAGLGLSHNHLDREFARVVGLRPRELARLLLLRAILDGLDPLDDVSWARVAADGGWADQAHFSRDFKRHTGVSPRRYLAIQREFARAGNAGPGFSPDLDAPR